MTYLLKVEDIMKSITIVEYNNQLYELKQGQLKIAGWDKQATSLELHRANEVACKPPLRKDEVNTIIRSVYKYEN